MGLLTTSVPIREDTTQTLTIYSENTTLPNLEPKEVESFFILIPMGVLLGIILLSLLVNKK